MISRSRTGNIKQLALGVVYIFEIGVIPNRFDPFL